MTDVAYKPLSLVEQIFKDVIWTPMIRAGETWIEGYVPFLALPIIKQMDEALIEFLTDAIFNQIILLIDVSAIKLVNAVHQSEYERISIKLKIIAHDRGIDSTEFQKAKEEDAAAFAKFVGFGAV